MKRLATVRGSDITLQRVDAFLPAGYGVIGWDEDGDGVLIEGWDNAGWTMEDYVVPRLASGSMFAEVTT